MGVTLIGVIDPSFDFSFDHLVLVLVIYIDLLSYLDCCDGEIPNVYCLSRWYYGIMVLWFKADGFESGIM